MQPIVGPDFDTPSAACCARRSCRRCSASTRACSSRRRRRGRRPARGGAAPGGGPVNVAGRRRRLAHARAAPRAGARAPGRRAAVGPARGRRAARGGPPPLPPEVERYLRYGRGVDVTRMRTELRFGPRHSTIEASAKGATVSARPRTAGASTPASRGARRRCSTRSTPLLARPAPRRRHVPATGPALVANHAGPPWDAAMLTTACAADVRRDDPPRLLVPDGAFELPWLSIALRRFGGVPAAPGNAARLLAEGHLVLAFPEGARGTSPDYERRYRLERFGRGGFVEIALRTGAPIVPCARRRQRGPRLADRVLARVAACRAHRVPPPAPCRSRRWRIEFGGRCRRPLRARAAEDRAPCSSWTRCARSCRRRCTTASSSARERSDATRVQSPKEFREVMDRTFSMMDPTRTWAAAARGRRPHASSSPTPTSW